MGALIEDFDERVPLLNSAIEDRVQHSGQTSVGLLTGVSVVSTLTLAGVAAILFLGAEVIPAVVSIFLIGAVGVAVLGYVFHLIVAHKRETNELDKQVAIVHSKNVPANEAQVPTALKIGLEEINGNEKLKKSLEGADVSRVEEKFFNKDNQYVERVAPLGFNNFIEAVHKFEKNEKRSCWNLHTNLSTSLLEEGDSLRGGFYYRTDEESLSLDDSETVLLEEISDKYFSENTGGSGQYDLNRIADDAAVSCLLGGINCGYNQDMLFDKLNAMKRNKFSIVYDVAEANDEEKNKKSDYISIGSKFGFLDVKKAIEIEGGGFKGKISLVEVSKKGSSSYPELTGFQFIHVKIPGIKDNTFPKEKGTVEKLFEGIENGLKTLHNSDSWLMKVNDSLKKQIQDKTLKSVFHCNNGFDNGPSFLVAFKLVQACDYARRHNLGLVADWNQQDKILVTEKGQRKLNLVAVYRNILVRGFYARSTFIGSEERFNSLRNLVNSLAEK